MSYINKCVYKTDLLMNKLKPSSNLILFILSENNYLGYTLNDIKEIIKESKNHYIENEDKLETFFYLPHRIVIDSSLRDCLNNKTNTMKLIKNKNKFRIGFGVNMITYEFYSVEPIQRREIGCIENSVFDENLKDENENEEVVLDWNGIKKQSEERKELELTRLTKEEKKWYNEKFCLKAVKKKMV